MGGDDIIQADHADQEKVDQSSRNPSLHRVRTLEEPEEKGSLVTQRSDIMTENCPVNLVTRLLLP